MITHIMFTDANKNVHVAPIERIFLDGDSVDLTVTVVNAVHDYRYPVGKIEFERLRKILIDWIDD